MHEGAIPMARIPGSVLLVEDDAAVRRSLSLLLQLHGFRTEEFGSAEEFVAARIAQRPACALVDIRLPGMSGLALQARIDREPPALPVILMTAQGDAAIARTALLQGAVDFLEKPIDENQLLEAVDLALHGDAAQMVRTRERDELLALVADLTQHERKLFERITDGRHYREIAEEFDLTPTVLEAQRAHLMQKLRARRVADLFRLRFRIGKFLSGSRAPL